MVNTCSTDNKILIADKWTIIFINLIELFYSICEGKNLLFEEQYVSNMGIQEIMVRI